MKILCISSVSYGGAGLYAISIEKLLNEFGHDTYAIYKDNAKQTKYSIYRKNIIERLRTRYFKLFHFHLHLENKYHFFNKYEYLKMASATKLLKMCPFKPDAIFLFWISEFINASTIAELQSKTGAQIYWFMLDNAPITGGCHYPWQCKGYETNCYPCPAIISPKGSRIADKNLEYKYNMLPQDISLICYSNNDYKRAVNSKLFRNRKLFRHIAFVDDIIYSPSTDKSSLKKSWGIDPELTVLTLGASNLNDERKGFPQLLKELNYIDNKEIAILVIGKCDKSLFKNKVIITGIIDEADLIRAYQASDLYLSPSLEDSGPIMINQALMCGIPVISYDTGVASNLIEDYKSGYLIKNKTDSFIEGINWFLQLSSTQKAKISNNCREKALNLYGRKATKIYFETLFTKIEELT